jgi:hypothetical protein
VERPEVIQGHRFQFDFLRRHTPALQLRFLLIGCHIAPPDINQAAGASVPKQNADGY